MGTQYILRITSTNYDHHHGRTNLPQYLLKNPVNESMLTRSTFSPCLGQFPNASKEQFKGRDSPRRSLSVKERNTEEFHKGINVKATT